jgi:hypothetical protein
MARASLDLKPMAWPALLAVSSVVFSLGFACATPFVALATLAALTMRQRDASLTILTVWTINQGIGFGVHHYPHRLDTVAWGVMIAIAALSAGLMASGFGPAMRANRGIAGISAFISAFAVYETVLFVSALVLPGSLAAFAAPVMLRILTINVAALALFVCLRLVAGARSNIGPARA